MTKNMDYSKVTPELITKVKDVIADGAKHTYSVSKVYAAYNAAYSLRETPQTCSSCLRTRVRLLTDWLKKYEDYAKLKTPPAGDPDMSTTQIAAQIAETVYQGVIDDNYRRVYIPDDTDPNNPQYGAPAPGVIRIPMQEGAPIDLTPASEDDQTKGKLSYADGAKVSPGRYTTARGETIVVQVGSKGRIEIDDLT